MGIYLGQRLHIRHSLHATNTSREPALRPVPAWPGPNENEMRLFRDLDLSTGVAHGEGRGPEINRYRDKWSFSWLGLLRTRSAANANAAAAAAGRHCHCHIATELGAPQSLLTSPTNCPATNGGQFHFLILSPRPPVCKFEHAHLIKFLNPPGE